MARRRQVPEIVLLAIPGMVLVALSVMQESFEQWSAEWGWAWSQWAAQVQLTAPMTGGLAAWLVYDARRAGRGEWLATTPRGGALLRRHVLAATVPAVVAAAATGAGLPFVVGARGAVEWPLLPALSVAAAILGAAAIGGVAARLLSKAIAVPLVVVLLWGVVVGLIPLGSAWLRVGGAGHTLAGYEVVGALPIHRAIATVAVMCTAVLVLSPRPPSRWTSVHRLSAVGAGLGVVAVLLGSGWFAGGTYDIRPDPQAVADSCSSTGATVVCALPEHARAAQAARPAIVLILEARRALGIATPGTVTELAPHDLASADGRHGPDPASLAFTIDPFSETRNADAATSLVLPATCFAAQDGLSQEQFEVSDDAKRVLALWASTVVRQPFPGGQDDPAWVRFSALSPRAQADWLRSAITAADACRFEDFRSLAS
jgi:hypothetical protein